MQKEQKGTPKECVSTNATSDIQTYFLLKSAIKFLLTKEQQPQIN